VQYITVQNCNREDSPPRPPVWYETKRSYIICSMLQSDQQCVLYLHFSSTASRVSFHTGRKIDPPYVKTVSNGLTLA